MTDPLFGSVSPPLWPAIPAPVYGYAQSPLASGHRFGTIAPGSPAQGSASVGPFSAGPTLNAPAVDPHAFGGRFRGPELCHRIVCRRLEPTRQRRARLHGRRVQLASRPRRS